MSERMQGSDQPTSTAQLESNRLINWLAIAKSGGICFGTSIVLVWALTSLFSSQAGEIPFEISVLNTVIPCAVGAGYLGRVLPQGNLILHSLIYAIFPALAYFVNAVVRTDSRYLTAWSIVAVIWFIICIPIVLGIVALGRVLSEPEESGDATQVPMRPIPTALNGWKIVAGTFLVVGFIALAGFAIFIASQIFGPWQG